MKLTDIPDIEFVDIDAEKVEASLFAAYTSITGRTLGQADPIRLFILFVAEAIIRLLNVINNTGKQNLVKYATSGYLDALAANAWTTRIQASAAATTIKATLSAPRSVETVIPAGTRISPGEKIYFVTDEDLIIPAGDTEGTVAATCTETGTTGNGYAAGEISTVIDPVAYVASMVNITKSEGGADIEQDDALRERVWEAPEALSVAGPAGAYRAKAMAVNSAIVDVCAYSPEPGVVEVVPLLAKGELPGEELLADVLEALDADTERPLTDHVKTAAPVPITYDIDVTYYIMADASAVTVQTKAAEAVTEYVEWQRKKLGRDITPDKLQSLLYAVPGIKRIRIASPVHTIIKKTQVAFIRNISVTMAGSEEE